MSFQFMPLYTGDYLRDTRHLSPLKHGIFMLLLMNSWDQKAPIPLDEQEIAGIANCRSQDEVEALRYVLDRYFIRMDDGWYNKRMQKEIERAEVLSNQRSNAGKRGYQAKAKQLLSKSQATASTPTPTPTPTPYPQTVDLTPTPKKSKALVRATRLPEDWMLPKAWGEWARQERETLTTAEVRHIAERFRDYWIAVSGSKGTKLDWYATWRNWVRNESAPRKNKSVAEENKNAIAAWKAGLGKVIGHEHE